MVEWYNSKVMKRIILAILINFNIGLLLAQKLPIEILAGNNAVNTQYIVNKKFSETSRFGVFSVINFNMPYDKQNIIYKYHIVQSNIFYSLSKHISVFAGGFTNPKDYGASLGLQARFPFKNGMFFISNRNSVLTNYSSEFLVMTEFRPKLTEKFNLYSRVQAMTETDFIEAKRNFQMLRLGLGFKQYLFGLGATFDQFGNKPIKEENYGIFVRAEL
jgi:hypothetical protein